MRVESLAGVSFLERFFRQKDAAHLRQQGRDLDLPDLAADQLLRQAVDNVAHPRGSTKSNRPDGREGVDQNLDRSQQRRGEDGPLGSHQPILFQRGIHRLPERFGRAGLGQKAEDPPFVDRRDGDFQVRAGQHQPHRVGRFLLHLLEELDAVHAVHIHVGDDDGERSLAIDLLQSLGAAMGERNRIFRSQVA